MSDNATQVYFADWEASQYEGMVSDFAPPDVDVKPDEVLFACYTYEDYDGSAFVLFERAGTLYEVHGSHCSCYGLEGQWEPEATTWAALAMRPNFVGDDAASTALQALIAAHVPATECDASERE